MGDVMKRFTLCIVAVLIFFSMGVTCLASSMPYVGNKSTKVYHISECTYAGEISTKNRIYFRSRSEAEANGYRRCHYCGDGVVEHGHSGGGGSGSGSNSGSSNSGSSSNQTTVEKPQKESRTIGEELWEIIRIILILVCVIAWPIIISLPFSAIYQIVIWLRNKKRKKTSSSNTTECKTSQVAHDYKPPKKKASSCKLKSSAISEVEFVNDVIYVTFINGGTYAYYNVPREIYDGLVNAQSPGKYFHEKINGIYPYYTK